MRIRFLPLMTFASVLMACSVSVDPSSVKARAGAPEAAQVEPVQIAKTPGNATTFLVVEPVRVAEQGGRSETTIAIDSSENAKDVSQTNVKIVSSAYRNYLLNRQRQISYQLTTALAGVGDFSIVDYEKYQDSTPSASELGGGVGPYYVRAVITECSSGVVSEKRRKVLPLIYRKRENLVEGIVGLDVSVIDPSSGKVVTSLPVQSTYVSVSKSAKGGFIATMSSSEVEMKSTVDQALRLALNTAATKLHERLYQK